MKTQRNILIAFILNFFFSVFEIVGGAVTGSVAIVSDAVHDLGDALSIGVSYYLERKSLKKPDQNYTYGYARYSVIGAVITCLILLVGSLFVVFNAVNRIINPTKINYDGMIIFAVVGAVVNLAAAIVTHRGDSLNQKAVNLHMLEDVLGWIVVLIGAVVMRFTDFALIDPVMSICVAVFIFINAVKTLKSALNIITDKIPDEVSVSEIKHHICEIEGVLDAHHIHIWTTDGTRIYATMHVVTNEDFPKIKQKVREELSEHGIFHTTLELECENEPCEHKTCNTSCEHHSHHHHHHHHHSHSHHHHH